MHSKYLNVVPVSAH